MSLSHDDSNVEPMVSMNSVESIIEPNLEDVLEDFYFEACSLSQEGDYDTFPLPPSSMPAKFASY